MSECIYFLAVLEPRISGVRAEVVDRLSFDGAVRVEAITFLGGISCLWKKNMITVDVLSTLTYCVSMKINPTFANPWILSIVYRSSEERCADKLWDELREFFAANGCTPWCVMGDFNSVLHAHEKIGGGAFNNRAGQKISQCILYCNLVDLGYKGPMYT